MPDQKQSSHRLLPVDDKNHVDKYPEDYGSQDFSSITMGDFNITRYEDGSLRIISLRRNSEVKIVPWTNNSIQIHP